MDLGLHNKLQDGVDGMTPGAFALLDCLGFKGIWERHSPDDIVRKLTTVKQIILSEVETRNSHYADHLGGVISAKVLLISDSIAVSLKGDAEVFQREGVPEGYLIGIIVMMVGRIVDHFLLSEPSMVLRGCITFGQHLCQDNFIMGPAVDECSENERLAEGAFVWLLPNAEQLFPEYRDFMGAQFERVEKDPSLLDKTTVPYPPTLIPRLMKTNLIQDAPYLVEEYPMPIKQARTRRSSIVNVLAAGPGDDHTALIARYATAMESEDSSVQAKSQNTANFLAEASRQKRA